MGNDHGGMESFDISAKANEGADEAGNAHDQIMVRRRRLFAFCDYGLFAFSMALLIALVVLSFTGHLTKVLLGVMLPIAIICYGLSLFIYFRYRKRKTKQTHVL